MQDLLANIRCLLLVTDRTGTVRALSADMAGTVSTPLSELVGQNMAVFLTPAGRVFMQTHVWPTLLKVGELLEGYLTLRHHVNGDIPVMFNAHMSMVEGEPLCYWVFFQIKDRSRFEAELIAARSKAQELTRQLSETNQALEAANHDLRLKAALVETHNQQLEVLSQTDVLTGVGNRRALQAAFQLWRDAQVAAAPEGMSVASLLMVDADHFKRVNDTWSHDEGDRVLVALAQALRASVRVTDHVSRFGGEEFVVWLPQATADVAHRVSEGIHQRIRQIAPGSGDDRLTVSIGQVTLSGIPSQMDLEQWLRSADRAVYSAKDQGRNQTVVAHDPDVNGSAAPG